MRTTSSIVSYECVLILLHDRVRFDVRFYIVSLIFILFDVEVIYMFHGHFCGNLEDSGFFSMHLFIAMLLIGFIYESAKGALD